MTLEELEHVWATQPAPAVRAVEDVDALKRELAPELKRRRRMLGYGIFMAAFGLLVFPALAVANHRAAAPHVPVWHWVNLAIWMTLYAAGLAFLIRQIRRQQKLLRQSADTLRAVTLVSLASREAEMQDYRRGFWLLLPTLGLQIVNLYLKFPVADHGWQPFAMRAAATLGFSLLLGSVFWRHYRVHLKPAHAAQKEILRGLS